MTTAPRPADLSDAEIERRLRSGTRLDDAPEHVIQRAMAVWQPRRAAAAAPGLLERLLAVLSFDSGAAAPLAYGKRSAGGTTRQLLFAAEGHDIDVRIGPAAGTPADRWQLSGQVLGPEANGSIDLADEHGGRAGQATLNELGEFRLPVVAPGRYTLTVQLGTTEIVLPSIDVPQAA